MKELIKHILKEHSENNVEHAKQYFKNKEITISTGYYTFTCLIHSLDLQESMLKKNSYSGYVQFTITKALLNLPSGRVRKFGKRFRDQFIEMAQIPVKLKIKGLLEKYFSISAIYF